MPHLSKVKIMAGLQGIGKDRRLITRSFKTLHSSTQGINCSTNVNYFYHRPIIYKLMISRRRIYIDIMQDPSQYALFIRVS